MGTLWNTWVFVRALNENQAIWANSPTASSVEEITALLIPIVMRRGYVSVLRVKLVSAGTEILVRRWDKKIKFEKFLRRCTFRTPKIWGYQSIAENGVRRASKANDIIEICIARGFIEIVPDTKDYYIRITEKGLRFATVSGLLIEWKEEFGDIYKWYSAVIVSFGAGIFGGTVWSWVIAHFQKLQ